MTAIYPANLPGLTWSTTWQPAYKTAIQTAASGQEFRASLMAYPIYSITLQYEFLRSKAALAELQTLAGFYMARRGSFEAFHFEFDQDKAAQDQALTASTSDGKSFRLVRSFGGAVEPVQNIKAVTAVKVAGVAKTAADYTVSDTGMLTFTTAPQGTVTWSGSYYYRCRFAADDVSFTRFLSQFWEAKTIELIATLGRRI